MCRRRPTIGGLYPYTLYLRIVATVLDGETPLQASTAFRRHYTRPSGECHPSDADREVCFTPNLKNGITRMRLSVGEPRLLEFDSVQGHVVFENPLNRKNR